MAFNRSWDESLPTGSEAASDIDLIFRQLKEDIRERLEDVSTFGTDEDPLVLLEGTARLTVDTSGSKPATPDKEGLLFYETDTGTLYVAEDDGGLAWVEITASSTTASNVIGFGSIDDRPSSGLSPGQLYYATDSDYGVLYVATTSDDWKTVAPAPNIAYWDETNADGSKVTSWSTARKIVTLIVDGVDLENGTSLALSELNPALSDGFDVSVSDIVAVFASVLGEEPGTITVTLDEPNNEIDIDGDQNQFGANIQDVKLLIVVDH